MLIKTHPDLLDSFIEDANNKHDDAFGLCPVCKQNGDGIDCHWETWLVCRQHKLRWRADVLTQRELLFFEVDKKALKARLIELSKYLEVQAFHWPPMPSDEFEEAWADGLLHMLP